MGDRTKEKKKKKNLEAVSARKRADTKARAARDAKLWKLPVIEVLAREYPKPE